MRHPLIYILIALIAALPCSLDAKAKKRTSSDARAQRQQTEQQLRQTSTKLTATEADINRRLGEKTRLQQHADAAAAEVTRLQSRIDSIGRCTRLVNDSIAANEAELAQLRRIYTDAVRAARRSRRELNTVTFLFSAETFSQAYRRLHYVEQYSAWRERKTTQIQELMTQLEEQKARLAVMHTQATALKQSAEIERRRLRTDLDSVNTIVVSLRGQKKELNSLLKKQQTKLKQLDQEIDRLIAAEEAERKRQEELERQRQAAAAAAKAKQQGSSSTSSSSATASSSAPEKDPAAASATTAQTGEFAAQKGKLPSPLSHKYTVVRAFGLQSLPDAPKVQVDNSGIDMETASGATVSAVYPGEVSRIFIQNGFNSVILIRHGQYITVYANVTGVAVKKGDKVKCGTKLGLAGESEYHPGRSMLHFEIRKEKQKFDPQQWLKTH